MLATAWMNGERKPKLSASLPACQQCASTQECGETRKKLGRLPTSITRAARLLPPSSEQARQHFASLKTKKVCKHQFLLTLAAAEKLDTASTIPSCPLFLARCDDRTSQRYSALRTRSLNPFATQHVLQVDTKTLSTTCTPTRFSAK